MTKTLQRVQLLLALGMGASLTIVLVTGGIALILIGQPSTVSLRGSQTFSHGFSRSLSLPPSL